MSTASLLFSTLLYFSLLFSTFLYPITRSSPHKCSHGVYILTCRRADIQYWTAVAIYRGCAICACAIDRCPLRGPGRHSRQKEEEWRAAGKAQPFRTAGGRAAGMLSQDPF